MSTIVFVDLETTGLDAHRHEIWEAAAVKVEFGAPGGAMFDSMVINVAHWFPSVTLVSADDEALKIGGFAERYDTNKYTTAYDFIGEFGEFTEGHVIAANNVAFDMSFLKAYWSRLHEGKPEPWHYSPVDVKSYAAGALGWSVPLPKSSEIGAKLGVEVNGRPHHATADAYYAMDLYEAALRYRAS